MSSITYLLILFGSALTALGGVWLKRGAEQVVLDQGTGVTLRSAVLNPQLLGGLFCYAFPILIWIYLLRDHELSKLQPMLAIVYVITPIFAIIMLNEDVSLLRWSGIFLIIFGVALVSQS